MSYRRPIITEVYAVLRLEEGSLTSTDLFDIVPVLREAGYGSVELGGVGEVQVQAQAQAEPLRFDPRVRCWNEERTRLIQVATDYLAANHAVQGSEYLGWNRFREVLDTAVETYTGVMDQPVRAISVEVATIDEIVADSEGFTLGRYLHCGGNKIPAWYSDAAVPADLSLGCGMLQRDGFNTRYKISLRIRDGQAIIRIDSHFSRLMPDDSLADVVESLHQESTTHFEELITDFTRNEVMGGIA